MTTFLWMLAVGGLWVVRGILACALLLIALAGFPVWLVIVAALVFTDAMRDWESWLRPRVWRA